MDSSGKRLHDGSRGKGGSPESDQARTYTRLPTTPVKIDNDQASNNQTTSGECTPRERGQVFEGHGHRTLPGKHTRDLYDKLKRREASVLAQLRTE